MNIGFIGLGIMGRPMAVNLLKGGYHLTVFDINKNAVSEVTAKGASKGEDARHVAKESDVIFTMLPKTEHLKSVLFGEDGVAKNAKSGSIVVDMSSISPVDTREISAQLNTYGINMVDAPVSGGEPKAIDATLSFMVGGEEEVFTSIKPLFETMGASVVLVGGIGSGTTAKLANQIMVNVNIAAMSEAFTIASKSGIDLNTMYEAIRGGLAGSAVLDAKAPLIFERNFVAGGRMDINAKDLTNVKDTAEQLNLEIPLTSQVLDMFQNLIEDGKASDDHGGLIQYYEKISKTDVCSTSVKHY